MSNWKRLSRHAVFSVFLATYFMTVTPGYASDVVWLEAEHPSTSTFDDIYVAQGLSGGRSLHFSTESDTALAGYTARYDVHIPEEGRYVLWGRRHLYYYDEGSIPLITRLKRYVELWWRIDGGAWQKADADTEPVGMGGPYPTSVGHLGYTRTGDAEMAGKTIGWYREGAVDLGEGMHVLEVTVGLRQETMTPLFQPRLNRYYGLLDAFVFAGVEYEPNGRVRPEDAYNGILDTRRVPMEYARVTVHTAAVGDSLPNLMGFNLGAPADTTAFAARIKTLRPELWRICHLYNKVKVGRDDSGSLTFDWTSLDQEIDRVIALGAEPLMCISYTPAILSSMPPDTPRGPVVGDPGMYPPVDYEAWEEVVYRTVMRYNVERKLNIRYWEVWNEPNNVFLKVWHLWEWTAYLPISSYFKDVKRFIAYARIYEAASRGAVRADPSIRIGGPAVLCDGDVEDFTGSVGLWVQLLAWWCDWNDLRLDFIPLHMYAGPPDSQSPDDYADLVNRARGWATRADGSEPEILIDEWNAWSMEGGHDNAKVYHAIWTMESLHAMMRAGVRRSVLYTGAFYLDIFERDGRPRPAYNLLKMVARLAPQSLATEATDDVRVVASRADEKVTVLLWRFGTAHRKVDVNLTGLPSDTLIHYRRFLVDEAHSNFGAGKGHEELELVDAGARSTASDGTLALDVFLPRTSATLVEITF